MNTKTTLLEQKEAAQRELDKLTREIEKAERLETLLGPEKLFAIELHNKQCRWNHTDQCSFLYRDPEFETTWIDEYGTHGQYLEKAKAILDIVDVGTAYNLLPFL